MSFKGYVDLEDTLYFLFTTRRFSTGAPYTLASTPVLSVYEENNATQITDGVSISADYDSVTGLNQATIVASAANGYESGKHYDVVITTGTVDSVSVVGEVVGHFIVGPASANVTQLLGTAWLTPGTAGTPDVNVKLISGDSGAADNLEAACDGNTYNVGGGAVVAASVTGAVGSVTGLTASDVGAIKTKTDYLPSATAGAAGGLFIAGANAATSVTTALTANITGNLSGSVGSVTGAVGSVTGNVGGNVAGSVASVTGAVGSVTGAVGSVTGLTASDVGAIKTKTDYLPSATAGAAGGVFIAGANAATSITTALTANITGNLSGSVGSVTGAVGSVTGNVGGNVAGSVGSVTGAVGSVTGAVGSVTGAVGSVTGNVGGNVTGSVGSVAAGGIAAASFAAGAINAAAIADAAIDNATFAADVGSTAIATNVIGIAAKKGVVDALNVDTYAEPGQEAPAATNTLVKKIGYLFKFLRNKITQSATELSVYDDAGSTVDQKATISDNGTTYTRGEIGTGA